MLEEHKQAELAESDTAETFHASYLNSFKEGRLEETKNKNR